MPGKRTLVGRGRPQELITAKLDEARLGNAGVMAVVGEPGVGKTALLDWAADHASDFFVLRAIGLESEADLSYAGLTTLLQPLGPLVAELTPARAKALASAMAIDDAPTGALAVAAATLELITRAAERHPVLVILDDAQWLDHASLQAVRFVVSRVARDRVVALIARRAGEPDPFGDFRDISGIGTRIELDVLDDRGTAELLGAGRTEDGRSSVPPVVARTCRELTGGNPLALLELRAQLDADQLAGRTPIDGPFRPGARVRQRFGRTIGQLPAELRSALLITALDDTMRPDVILGALAADGLGIEALLDLEKEELLDVGVDVRFRHPLLRSIALEEATAAEARRAHRALAASIHTMANETANETAIGTPESGDGQLGWALQQSLAWHLAGAAHGRDPAATRALSDVALQATRQGSPVAAARAWERAAAHAAVDERGALLLRSAGAFAKASMHASAAERFALALQESTTADVRGLALIGYADTLVWQDTHGAARLAAREAANVADESPRVAARLWVIAAMAASLGGDVEVAAGYARSAREVLAPLAAADGSADPQRIELDTIAATIDLYRGHERDAAAVLDLVDLLIADLDLSAADEDLLSGLQHVALVQIIRERWRDALRTCEAIRRGGRRLGIDGLEAFGNALAGELAWRRGRWPDALAFVDVDEAPYAHHRDDPLTFRHAVAARVRAVQGVPGAARDAAAVVAAAQTIGMVLLEVWARSSLGLAHLTVGDHAAAIAALEPAWDLTRRAGSGEPGMVWWHGDLLDAYVLAGRLDDARRLTDDLAAQTEATGRGWGGLVASRGRAVLAAMGSPGERDEPGERAAHEVEVHEALFAESIARAHALGAPFEVGRSLLALAEARGRRRSDRHRADDAFADAEQFFRRLGATPWAARAARGRVTGTDTGTDPGMGDTGAAILTTLTQAELRVAMAVGGGLTNREAADELYLSVRTVDWHLGSVYRKLGVRSRSELAAKVTRAGGGNR